MYDEFLLRVDSAGASKVQRVRLAELGMRERDHLQEWIVAHPDVLGEGVEIVTTEYDRWQTATGDPVLDRLDILGVDKDGRLVVAELKRDDAPHTIHMQAVNYAAMVSRLSLRDVAELLVADRARRNRPLDLESALAYLETERLVTVDSIRRPRIVLVASTFPPSVTASVVWLTEQGVEMSLLRYRAYRLADEQVVVSFSRLFPVPDVEEFTIGRRVEQPDLYVDDVGPDWDAEALSRLAQVGNAATQALLDLCAASDGEALVGVKDVARHASLSEGQVRGQLAGLTMLLRNPKNGFQQKTWPVEVTWRAGGVASYTMEASLAELWNAIKQPTHGAAGSQGFPPGDS